MPSVLDLVDKWGVPLIFLLLLLNYLRPKLDQIWNKAMGKEESESAAHLKITMHTDQRINEILLEARDEFDSSWITLWQYHNGSTSLNGFPFLKISATHQKSAHGYVPWAQLYQGLPTSLVFGPGSFTDGRCCLVTDENMDDLGVSNIMRSFRIQTMCVSPIYDSTNLQVGVLSVCFANATPLDEGRIRILERYAGRISTVLEMRQWK